MASILPIASFFLLWVILTLKKPSEPVDHDWRHTFILSCLIWGTFLTLSTEILSLFHALSQPALVLLWSGLVLILIILTVIFVYSGRKLSLPAWQLDRFSTCVLGFMVIIMITLGVIAWVAPPNNWDAMTYHMGRVVHWIQNKSVAPYPTNISRQLWQNPFAEFTITHFQILAGNDRLANFVQWFSMIACCMGVSLIARQLRANLQGQLLAAVISLTIPMGILQATSTQNDYVLGLWMVCFVYMLICFIKNPVLSNSLWVGLSLGLAILTKATAYPYLLPLVIFLGLFILIKYRRSFINLVIPIIGLVVILNAGHYIRNSIVYDNPFGPLNDPGFPVSNAVFTFQVTASNIIRNLGLHVWTPLHGENQTARRVIDFLHQNILGISVNDPRSTWPGIQYIVSQQPFHEDYAGNPLHLDLILIALLVYLASRSLRKSKLMTWYWVMLVSAFIVFCGYLRWQPWNSRIQLPLFVLWAPFIAAAFTGTGWIKKHFNILKILPLLLLIYALPWVLINQSKPLLPIPRSILQIERSSLLFFNYPALEQPYRGAVQFLESNHVTRAGLLIYEDDWEYPFWALANETSPPKGIDFEHIIIGQENPASQPPDYIITTQIDLYPSLTLGNTIYHLVWSSGPLAILSSK